jgi:triosephosphate isomerase
MTRIPLVGGNWKMHLDHTSAAALAGEIGRGVAGIEGSVELAVFPPHPYLGVVSKTLAGSGVATGGQDVSDEPSGAFTGQVAPSMLVDCGCTLTLVGHSERRHGLGEQDALLSRKVRMALDGGLRVLLCVGETLEQRDQGHTFDIVRGQLRAALDTTTIEDLHQVDLAYEPVWAIGTGRTAGSAEAQEVHAALRSELRSRYDARSAERIRIVYGGSVNAANAAELMACEDVDGALVGGASLQAESFLEIARAAARPEQP